MSIASNNSAYTLIEIILVIILIGILGSIGTSQFIDFQDEARTAVTQDRLNQLKIAISGDPKLNSSGKYTNPGYENHMNRLPTALSELSTQGLQADYDPFTKLGWRGPYVNTSVTDWDKDAWGNSFVYSSGARTITSNGPDETNATADDITINF